MAVSDKVALRKMAMKQAMQAERQKTIRKFIGKVGDSTTLSGKGKLGEVSARGAKAVKTVGQVGKTYLRQKYRTDRYKTRMEAGIAKEAIKANMVPAGYSAWNSIINQTPENPLSKEDYSISSTGQSIGEKGKEIAAQAGSAYGG